MGNNFISPLRRAVRANRPDRVKEILEKADRSAPDLINEDYTADCFLDLCQRNDNHILHTAISYQRWEIVDLLLEYGADPCSTGYAQESALHKAARQNNLTLVRKLMYYKADLYAQDARGSYPIHLAALSLVAGFWNQCETLRFLIDEVGKPDDVNLEDDDENTPLHNAALRGNEEACMYLLSKGAKPDARNVKGYSPIDIATTSKVKTLLQDALENWSKNNK